MARLKFIILSLIGLFFFVIPIPYNDETSIPVAIIADVFKDLLGESIFGLAVLIVVVSAIMTLIAKIIPSRFPEESFLGSVFQVSWFWTIVRLVGMVFIIFAHYQVGWDKVYSDATGGMILVELMPSLVAVFLIASYLLPLLLNYGLLEFIGALFTKIMRPVFTLPGRSTVDNLTSWLGDGTIGVLLTSRQYEEGFYTKREAAVIGTTFSVVSITFTIVVVDYVGLMHMFLPLYLTILAAGLVAAIIMPRIPPLSRIPDTYYTENSEGVDETIPEGHSSFSWGYKQAIDRAEKSPGIGGFFKEGTKNAMDMWFGVLPVVMAIGTLGVIVAEETMFFTWIGAPFVPILELFQVPEAQAAAETVLVGFTDMFLPALMIGDVASEITRFIIAALSVTQLIYLSEVGGVLLASKVPVNFGKLVVIFLLRTLITLPIIILAAHMIF
ncbi:YjiH family protein [Piscibacillus halophilus]|uniref:Nucleoside recognition GATE domain-containing membrane protein YjiH n=1 Tax=Piscibacillus halophilus TaxID=571933 RepID=A0A1H9K3I4_9BACI|nr:YjiH family protein [Piscibacillus halophilus]SEQ93766.1 nucleoside recognition GATE domain-containing membrane protein YjiH [Piscibacillus halophilus]